MSHGVALQSSTPSRKASCSTAWTSTISSTSATPMLHRCWTSATGLPGRVYRPGWRGLTVRGTAAFLLWLSSVMEFSSCCPTSRLAEPRTNPSTSPGTVFAYAFGLLDAQWPTHWNDNLNDTAFNQDTANTAGGINGAGPTGNRLNSFYGPWLERIDAGLGRSSKSVKARNWNFRRKRSTVQPSPTTTSKTEAESTNAIQPHWGQLRRRSIGQSDLLSSA